MITQRKSKGNEIREESRGVQLASELLHFEKHSFVDTKYFYLKVNKRSEWII